MKLTDYQGKIAGLLTKAEAADNQHEAEVFSRKAEELMLKWGIDEAVVRARMSATNAPERIVRKPMLYKGTYSKAHISFAYSVCEGMGGVRVFQKATRKSDTYLILVGHESDVARAEMLLASLQLQTITALKVWWKTFWDKDYMSANEKFKARRQFILSFGQTVGLRLHEARTKIVETEAAGTELVLLDRGKLVDNWISDEMGPTRKARGMAGSHYGRAEGAAAGQRASLGGPSLSASRARIAA